MRAVFADTHFWVALTIASDPWHHRATQAIAGLTGVVIVTTEAVLVELLNFTSGYGPHTREQVARFVRGLLGNAAVEVVPCTHEWFVEGLSLYESRGDKAYSLTDCMSMQVMRARGTSEVLTNDRHFAQEGFIMLLAD